MITEIFVRVEIVHLRDVLHLLVNIERFHILLVDVLTKSSIFEFFNASKRFRVPMILVDILLGETYEYGIEINAAK